MTHIGIDPGVTTGLAVVRNGKLVSVTSGIAVWCEREVMAAAFPDSDWVKVWIEKPSPRGGFTGGKERLQGVGSVGRDYKRWVEWCEFHRLPWIGIQAKDNRTKLTHEAFCKLTDWTERTNSHGRDAAMLVFGR